MSFTLVSWYVCESRLEVHACECAALSPVGLPVVGVENFKHAVLFLRSVVVVVDDEEVLGRRYGVVFRRQFFSQYACLSGGGVGGHEACLAVDMFGVRIAVRARHPCDSSADVSARVALQVAEQCLVLLFVSRVVPRIADYRPSSRRREFASRDNFRAEVVSHGEGVFVVCRRRASFCDERNRHRRRVRHQFQRDVMVSRCERQVCRLLSVNMNLVAFRAFHFQFRVFDVCRGVQSESHQMQLTLLEAEASEFGGRGVVGSR